MDWRCCCHGCAVRVPAASGHWSRYLRAGAAFTVRQNRYVRSRLSSIPATVTAFAALGLAAVAIVAVIAGVAIRHITDAEALRDAKQLTRAAVLSAVEPDLSDPVVIGDPAALATLDRTVRARVLRSPVVRVKLWTLDGKIVYSDARQLIGRRFALDDAERRAAQRGVVEADISDANAPENVFERGLGKLLEVYLPVRTPDGHRLLYEEYLRYGAIADSGRRQWLALLPAFGGALLVLALAQLPLAWWLARRLEQREQEREALLVRLVEASDRERRQLAQALHEGPVQALAGLTWRLSAAARQADPPLAGELETSAGAARQAQRDLRSLLVTLHPPNLRRVGLHAALADTAAPLRDAGVQVKLDLAADADLAPDAEALVYRVAEEGLRNAHQHAAASHVAVCLRREDGRARLRVRDDGRGFPPEVLADRHAGGHRGLALLHDLAVDAGGELTVNAAPGRGTTLELDTPAS
jgi:signal transduction histidine kinase